MSVSSAGQGQDRVAVERGYGDGVEGTAASRGAWVRPAAVTASLGVAVAVEAVGIVFGVFGPAAGADGKRQGV